MMLMMMMVGHCKGHPSCKAVTLQ